MAESVGTFCSSGLCRSGQSRGDALQRDAGRHRALQLGRADGRQIPAGRQVRRGDGRRLPHRGGGAQPHRPSAVDGPAGAHLPVQAQPCALHLRPALADLRHAGHCRAHEHRHVPATLRDLHWPSGTPLPCHEISRWSSHQTLVLQPWSLKHFLSETEVEHCLHDARSRALLLIFCARRVIRLVRCPAQMLAKIDWRYIFLPLPCLSEHFRSLPIWLPEIYFRNPSAHLPILQLRRKMFGNENKNKIEIDKIISHFYFLLAFFFHSLSICLTFRLLLFSLFPSPFKTTRVESLLKSKKSHIWLHPVHFLFRCLTFFPPPPPKKKKDASVS